MTIDELLAPFHAAGLLAAADVHVARRLAELGGEADATVALALALAVRALRSGSVCIDLQTVAQGPFEADDPALVEALPWPDPQAWQRAVAVSPLTTVGPDAPGTRPLRLIATLVYLERYWGHEEGIRDQLVWRRSIALPHDEEVLATSLRARFTRAGLDDGEIDYQAEAARSAVVNPVTVIAGGPGTGKTTTVAKVLSVLLDQPGGARRIALAAPTGKAAVRLEESLRHQLDTLPDAHAELLGGLSATTLHRLLQTIPGNATRFRHDATHPLPHDVVVVDECSMVSVHLMHRLLEALRPGARLILVGDPDQLASVEAGAVLADIVHAVHDRTGVVRLTRTWRFGTAIDALATAIRDGDPEGALAAIAAHGEELALREVDVTTPQSLPDVRERVVACHRAVLAAARAGDALTAVAALDRHRVLCAHNTGPWGVSAWQWQIERWLAEDVGGFRSGLDDFYVGRPLLIGTNLRDVELYNGDTGVVIATDDGPRAAFARGGTPHLFSPTQLADVSTLFAMTVHKSQGSQYEHVTVVLPPVGSPLLTRELLYTAVTRASGKVTLVGSAEALRQAILTPASRATGLRDRL